MKMSLKLLYFLQAIMLSSYSLILTQDFGIALFILFVVALIGHTYYQTNRLKIDKSEHKEKYSKTVLSGLSKALFLSVLMLVLSFAFPAILNMWITMAVTLLLSANPEWIESLTSRLFTYIKKFIPDNKDEK